jgi:FlaA1/EpsC-like NDP-sugar epimerase
MENHGRMIFLNNVIGTRNLLDISLAFGIKKFICISTDKAVYPLSVMGKTKRICELLTGIYNVIGLDACSVRFGNVLGSNGSVLTVFQEQIRRGGPITITSPYMERYFMTVLEATSLVMQAATCRGNGNIYVLDMGKPIKIKDLAENLIILSGLTPGVDIETDYTGVRAGEKLREELFYREADIRRSRYREIFVEENIHDGGSLLNDLDNLARNIYSLTNEQINREIDNIINTYNLFYRKSEIVV